VRVSQRKGVALLAWHRAIVQASLFTLLNFAPPNSRHFTVRPALAVFFRRTLVSLAGVVLVAQPPFIMRLLGIQAGPEQEWTQGRLVGMALGLAGAVFSSLAYVTIRVIGR